MKDEIKIEIIDQFLPRLKERRFGTISEVLDNSPKAPSSKIDLYRLVEFDLEKFDLVILLEGRDNSTIDGMCRYRISPRGIEFVLNHKSVAELYQNQNDDNHFKNINIHNLVISENSNIGDISQESLKNDRKRRIGRVIKWIFAVIATVSALVAIYEFLINNFNKG